MAAQDLEREKQIKLSQAALAREAAKGAASQDRHLASSYLSHVAKESPKSETEKRMILMQASRLHASETEAAKQCRDRALKRLLPAVGVAILLSVIVVQLNHLTGRIVLAGPAVFALVYTGKCLVELFAGRPFNEVAERSEDALQLLVLSLIALMVVSIVIVVIMYLGPGSLLLRWLLILAFLSLVVFGIVHRLRSLGKG